MKVEDNMKIVSKVGIVVASVAMTIGLLGSPAEALRDTSWGGCCGVSSNR